MKLWPESYAGKRKLWAWIEIIAFLLVTAAAAVLFLQTEVK